MDRPVMPESEVAGFFKHYRSEFDDSNWPAVIALYNEPAFSVRGDGTVKSLASRRDVQQLFEEGSSMWRREGYSQLRESNLRLTSLGNKSILATLDWSLLREDGSEIRNWCQSYQLVLVGEDWKILASTFHSV